MQFIDLFAGIGGFRLGFQDYGECVYSSEKDDFAAKTYLKNFGDVPAGDITKIPSADIPDHDLLLAGFPCQSFSMAGMRGGFADIRGTMFFEIARILKDKNTPQFVLENVPGLLSHDKGRTFTAIENELFDLGYSMTYFILNAKDYGLPQNRARLFIVGAKTENDVEMTSVPPPQPLSGGVGSILESGVEQKYYLSQKYCETLIAHRNKHEAKGNGFGYQVLNPHGLANTIVIGGMGIERNLIYQPECAGFLCPNSYGWRRMTPREWARLQGFSETFVFPVSNTQAYKQIANAVPVNVVRALAKEMFDES